MSIQVAAAAAVLCMDPAPRATAEVGDTGGTTGYWQMIDAIRAAMPPDRMITTECNAESFYPLLRWLPNLALAARQHGPVFPRHLWGYHPDVWPQLRGNAGAEEPTQALAWRMRAGQQFVYGEQDRFGSTCAWLAKAICP